MCIHSFTFPPSYVYSFLYLPSFRSCLPIYIFISLPFLPSFIYVYSFLCLLYPIYFPSFTFLPSYIYSFLYLPPSGPRKPFLPSYICSFLYLPSFPYIFLPIYFPSFLNISFLLCVQQVYSIQVFMVQNFLVKII